MNTMGTKETQNPHEGDRKYARIPDRSRLGQSPVLELPSFQCRVRTHFCLPSCPFAFLRALRALRVHDLGTL